MIVQYTETDCFILYKYSTNAHVLSSYVYSVK